MKKVLYITSMPWGWIKQRPQFIPEYLSKHIPVDVFYKKSNTQSGKVLINPVDCENDSLKIHSYRLIPFYAIPFLRRLPLNWINKLLLDFQLPKFDDYDVIWYTSPLCYKLTSSKINNQTVVYDCMDDHLEFPDVKNDDYQKSVILANENNILQNSSVVICSAQYLADKIISRSGIESSKVRIINNAIELPSIDKKVEISTQAESVIEFLKTHDSMLYVGTIEKWFDFNTILEVLNSFPDLHLVLLGPGKNNVIDHERIHYMGIIQHKELFSILDHSKALVMPFIVNELIRSVNPVKLYEYIYSGKPVIAPRYGESLKFEPFVQLYNNADEFKNIINSLPELCQKINLKKCRDFVKDNTWECRCTEIAEIINNYHG